MPLPIDTLNTARRLERGGFTASEAEAITYALLEALRARQFAAEDRHDDIGAVPATSARSNRRFLAWLFGSQIVVALALAVLLHAFRTAG